MRTFAVDGNAKIYVYSEPIHMGASFRRLKMFIEENMKKKPDEGDCFLFVNEHMNRCKIFYHHEGGYCIWAKKLDAGKFKLNLARKTLTRAEMLTVIEDVLTRKAEAA